LSVADLFTFMLYSYYTELYYLDAMDEESSLLLSARSKYTLYFVAINIA